MRPQQPSDIPRCQVFVATPGTTGELLQCINAGTHWETIPGCGCTTNDMGGVCFGDATCWTCNSPRHNFGA